MKKFTFIFLFLMGTTLLNAQITDEEARRDYQAAEEQYEAGNYYKCYQMCFDLMIKMGKPNPRVLYLNLKAIYNNLEMKNDKSEYTLKKNYINFSTFNDYATEFFSLIDKKSYPPEKYAEIAQIQQYLNEGMKKYEYEKGRKPEDAVAFLNECGEKFGGNFQWLGTRRHYESPDEKSKVRFELFGSLLKITTYNPPPLFREKGIIRFEGIIHVFDFSKILSLYNGAPLYSGGKFLMPCIPEGVTTYEDGKKIVDFRYYKSISIEILTNKKVREENQELYDNTLKNFMLYVNSSAESPDLSEYSRGGNNDVFDFFAMKKVHTDEFTDIYRSRIMDAIEYLIDYYPKIESNKVEKKNGF